VYDFVGRHWFALVNNGCFDFRPKSNEDRNENQRKPLRSPDAIDVLVGPKAPILQEGEQISDIAFT